MKVTFYGTRGSCPVASTANVRFGGNTTCVRLQSECLPVGMWFVIDAGTGILPLGQDFIRQQGKALTVVFSHWHHDHTQGFPLSIFPYFKTVPVDLWGPYEHGIGARRVYEQIMKPPVFPIHFQEVASHINCHNLEFPNATLLLVHPAGGVCFIHKSEYERFVANHRHLPFGRNQAFDAKECLVVRMHRSNHPEQTIAYRFEENPTGKVFTFVTDHEDQSGIPSSFRQHLANSDLLVMDCQYNHETYTKMTCGWGHGTPEYVSMVANEVGAKTLGLTHHNPGSDDAQVEAIVETAAQCLAGNITVFGCRDYQEVEV